MREILHDSAHSRRTSSPEDSPTIIIYARHPRPGAVKTRLAMGIGAENAAIVYAIALDHVLQQLKPLASRMRVVIDAATEDDVPALRVRAPWAADVRPQCAGDIGERMSHSLERALDEGASCALLTGSDLPGLETTMLTCALDLLASHDAVLGPARDGGYWLVGLRHACPSLFSDIRWGDDDVYGTSLLRASHCGISCAQAETLSDIDTLPDLQDWCHAHPLRPLTKSFESILAGRERADLG